MKNLFKVVLAAMLLAVVALPLSAPTPTPVLIAGDDPGGGTGGG
jgi:hypothetical protein